MGRSSSSSAVLVAVGILSGSTDASSYDNWNDIPQWSHYYQSEGYESQPQNQQDYYNYPSSTQPYQEQYGGYDTSTPNPATGAATGAATTQEQRYTPIDYGFQAKEYLEEERENAAPDVDSIPLTAATVSEAMEDDHGRDSFQNNIDEEDDLPRTQSARQDAVSRYMSTTNGRILLRASSTGVGLAFGAFVGKSLLNMPEHGSVLFGILFFIFSFLRNPYGELSKALGLVILSAYPRTFSIRRRYPTWPHVKASLGAAPRRPFPAEEDRQYNNLLVLVALGFLGSTVGGSFPFLPTWIGASAGAGAFVFASTLPTAQGDLLRTMGMRLVAVVRVLLDLNRELRVVNKLGAVSSNLLDKMLILDRKHRIKDKVVSGVSFVYEQIMVQVKTRQDGGGPGDRGDGGRRRDDGDRRDGGRRRDEDRRERGSQREERDSRDYRRDRFDASDSQRRYDADLPRRPRG